MGDVLRIIATAACLLALAGCFVAQGRREEADAKAQAAYAQCDELRRAGQYKTYAAAVECAVPTVAGAYAEAAYPFNDLIAVSIAARRVGARKIDNGDATEDEYRRDLAILQTRLDAEEARRRQIMKFGGNPQPVPLDSLVAGLSSFTTPSAGELRPRRPGDCIPLGAIKSCK